MNTRCDQCRTLTFRKPDADIGLVGTSGDGGRLVCILHRTKESWLRSIADGCHFCTLVKGQVYTYEVPSRVCDVLEAYVLLVVAVFGRPREAPKLTTRTVHIISRLGNASLTEIEHLPEPISTALERYALAHTLLRPKTRTNGQDLIRPALLANQSHPFNVELARLWIDDCLNNHRKCRQASSPANTEPRLPTRLIDVTDPRHPFLQETASLTNGQYVALSYCWGLGKKFTTLKNNYETFKTEIPTLDLPQTFKDAIVSASGLGFKYIWIDALCIIQNVAKDLTAELQIMGDIYRYATLTISAQGSASSHSGIFKGSRDPLSLAPCRVELTVEVTGDAPDIADRTLSGMCNGKDYLSPRGWILQEDILTSRALRFGSQMSWRCMESDSAETRPTPANFGRLSGTLAEPPMRDGFLPGERVDKDPLKLIRGWLYTPDLMEDNLAATLPATNARPPSSNPGPDVLFSWYSMVETYSCRELSFATDNLRALCGISDMFARIHSATYLAGLWKEDLVRGLGWYVATNDARPVVDVNSTREYTAPSWTWASVGKVRIRFAFLSPGFKSGPARYEQKGEVLDAHCAWGDPINAGNGKGSGQEWSLRLQAPARKAILRRSARYTEWRIKNRMFSSRVHEGGFDASKIASGAYMRFPGMLLNPDDDKVVLGEVALDSGRKLGSLPGHIDAGAGGASVRIGGSGKSANGLEDINVLCLFLDSYGSSPNGHILCLVVVPRAAGSSSYIRIGLGFLAGGQGFDKEDGVEVMDYEII